jgi:hypothetical protein
MSERVTAGLTLEQGDIFCCDQVSFASSNARFCFWKPAQINELPMLSRMACPLPLDRAFLKSQRQLHLAAQETA